MRYFIIAGEASGDIHGAALIDAIKQHDSEAQVEFLGGDLMAQSAGHAPLIHYRDMAFMGFIEVIKHLGSILGFMRRAKKAMTARRPDALILIDYPSFNLKMAKWAKGQDIPVFYFISPKVWAWKEYRVKDIKRYVTRMFSILPFETAFYRKHDYEVEYVGNPTVKEIQQAIDTMRPVDLFRSDNGLDPAKPIIAIVPGSREKEIRDNLPTMLAAALDHSDCQPVIAGAPSIDNSIYEKLMTKFQVPVLHDQTFELVHNARVALVTSGTATLETALLGTPQVACYRMNGSEQLYKFYSRLIKGKYVTLPNLIADEPIIPELLIHQCTVESVDSWLDRLLDDSDERCNMLAGYKRMQAILTTKDCATTTAQRIIEELNGNKR
ncbi:MAG: lipid-A-disaccharide synthase [Muribaculaceae bacterium]|nr:lipid-A-disaccharide synthase [Muribaculaceae bacterium]